MLPPWPNAAPPHSPRHERDERRMAGPPAADARLRSVEREQVLAPPRGNGHDNGSELLEIPAFLRRG